jgi:hypothetical protein
VQQGWRTGCWAHSVLPAAARCSYCCPTTCPPLPALPLGPTPSPCACRPRADAG